MSKSILTRREKEVFELLILNKTTKEIAQELVSYDGISETTHFEYGNVVDACLSIDKENTYEHYVWAINNIIEDYNADGQVGFCR